MSTNITTTIFNYNFLINLTDSECSLLLSITVFCSKSLSAFTKHYFHVQNLSDLIKRAYNLHKNLFWVPYTFTGFYSEHLR